MSIRELTRDQLVQVKQTMVMDRCGGDASWFALACADELVTDAEAFEKYDGTRFVEEDFA